MSQLKAFIGHSFSKNDEEVVRQFLNIFNQISNMNIGFSWEHAELAKPKTLAEKVKKIAEDKNLFIGICTIKEVAIACEELKSGVLNKKY